MEFLFNNQNVNSHHQQQQQNQHQQITEEHQDHIDENVFIQQQSKKIKLINHDERDLMFQVYQPWVLRTYGDNTKTKTITLKKQHRIINALKGFEINKYDSSKFKFWVKSKGFRDNKPSQFRELACINSKSFNSNCLLYIPNVTNSGIEEYKKVAVVESFFDIIYNVHESLENNLGRHAGQKRTYRTITKSYSFLPREAVTKFLSLCSECKTTDRSIALKTSEIIEIIDESDENSIDQSLNQTQSMDDNKKQQLSNFEGLNNPSKVSYPTSTSNMDVLNNSTITNLYMNLLEIYKQQPPPVQQLTTHQQPAISDSNSMMNNQLVNYYQFLKTFYDNTLKENGQVNSENQITSTVDLLQTPAIAETGTSGKMDDVETALPVHHINTVTPVYLPADPKKIISNNTHEALLNISTNPSNEFKFSYNSTPPKKRFNNFNQHNEIEYPNLKKTPKIEKQLNFDSFPNSVNTLSSNLSNSVNEQNLINFKCFDSLNKKNTIKNQCDTNKKFNNHTDPIEQQQQQQQNQQSTERFPFYDDYRDMVMTQTTTSRMISNAVANKNDKINQKGDILLNVNGNKYSNSNNNNNHNNNGNDINSAVLAEPITSTYLQLTRSMGLTDDDALNLESVSSAPATTAPPPDTSDASINIEDSYAGLLKDADKLKLMLLAWNYQNSNAVRNGTDGPDLNTMTGLWQQYQNALGMGNKSLSTSLSGASNDQTMSIDIQDDTNSLDQKDDDDGSEDDSDDRNDMLIRDPERLKAFNMFVRLFVDENLDRMIPISKQPKEKIQAIIDSCTRQFPEFTDRSRKRIRTYLKSCRRNKKTREGWDCNATRPTPAHLTSVQAEQILAMACENESLNAKRMRIGLEPISQVNTNIAEVPVTPTLFSTTTASANKTSTDSESMTPSTLLTTIAKTSPTTVSTNSLTNSNNLPATQNETVNGITNFSYTSDLTSTFAVKAEQYQSLLSSSSTNNNNNATTGTVNPVSGACPTDLSMKRQLLPHKLNTAEIVAVKQLVTGYRESAAFLMRSADELENLLVQQQ